VNVYALLFPTPPTPPLPMPVAEEFLRACKYESLPAAMQEFDDNFKSAVDSNGATAMHQACANQFVGSLEMVQWLHGKGVALDTPNNAGRTPIQEAAEVGSLDIVRWMHEEGQVPIDVKNNHGIHILHSACKTASIELVQYVRAKSGVDINIADSGGGTPVIYAAAGASAPSEEAVIELCTWLHGQGAQLNAANKAGITPLRHAENAGRTRLAEWIKATLGG
jgi:ankyrin repeat protein